MIRKIVDLLLDRWPCRECEFAFEWTAGTWACTKLNIDLEDMDLNERHCQAGKRRKK